MNARPSVTYPMIALIELNMTIQSAKLNTKEERNSYGKAFIITKGSSTSETQKSKNPIPCVQPSLASLVPFSVETNFAKDLVQQWFSKNRDSNENLADIQDGKMERKCYPIKTRTLETLEDSGGSESASDWVTTLVKHEPMWILFKLYSTDSE